MLLAWTRTSMEGMAGGGSQLDYCGGLVCFDGSSRLGAGSVERSLDVGSSRPANGAWRLGARGDAAAALAPFIGTSTRHAVRFALQPLLCTSPAFGLTFVAGPRGGGYAVGRQASARRRAALQCYVLAMGRSMDLGLAFAWARRSWG